MILDVRAQRIRATLRENHHELLFIYYITVYMTLHTHIRCALRTKTKVLQRQRPLAARHTVAELPRPHYGYPNSTKGRPATQVPKSDDDDGAEADDSQSNARVAIQQRMW